MCKKTYLKTYNKMKKKALLPRSIEIVVRTFAAILTAFLFMAIGFITASMMQCTNPTRANVYYDNALASRLERAHNIIYGYNSLLHRIWVDKPNYCEDVLPECDEFISLCNLVDDDFGGAFEFWSEEDSLSYALNWENGDKCVQVIKHVVSDGDIH